MPHAGSMDEKALGPEQGPLLRARLHMRGGKRRLKQGKVAAGIVTLSDAVSGALEWYVASPDRRSRLDIKCGENLNDERTVYGILVRSKVLVGLFDFDTFDDLVERGLKGEITDYDYRDMLEGIETVMIALGVMPFDEESLPPEDPLTY
jgi:hypothetical protein